MIGLNLETLGQKPGGEGGGQEKPEPPGCTSGVIPPPQRGPGAGGEGCGRCSRTGFGLGKADFLQNCRLLVSAPRCGGQSVGLLALERCFLMIREKRQKR